MTLAQARSYAAARFIEGVVASLAVAKVTRAELKAIEPAIRQAHADLMQEVAGLVEHAALMQEVAELVERRRPTVH